MRIVLYLVCFLSGMSALIFESLWFQLAGVTLGSSVWAASVVLASFMGGLALGNGMAAWTAQSIRHPIRIYAFLELAIGVSGLSLVFVFPYLPKMCLPIFQSCRDHVFLLNTARTLIAFALMLIPATAMGATLPILIQEMTAKARNLGHALGALYGWNTLGAVFGVMLSETMLVKHIGLTGAAGAAAGLNLVAACIGLVVFIRRTARNLGSPCEPAGPSIHLDPSVIRWLAASFIAGFIMLALEVVWYRFFLLFFDSFSWNFAVMLAVVLTGISLGGFLASCWFSRQNEAHRFTGFLAVLNTILIILLYRKCDAVLDRILAGESARAIVVCSFYFMFPSAVVSGIMFSMLGNALSLRVPSKIKTTGLLTLLNTFGGMCGAILAGTAIIPHLGIERAFFLLAFLYGIILILALPESQHGGSRKTLLLNGTGIGLFFAALAFFPFGKMHDAYLGRPIRTCATAWGEKRVAFKEGLHETLQYLRSDILGVPYYYRLVANNHSMASTLIDAKCYMRLYVYWPMALHSDPKRALLIGFGMGTTAQALTTAKTLKNIDIVDLSHDIVEMSEVVFTQNNRSPLDDPRVSLHIEDGRFFLQTTDRQYDIITAEPPPLMHKGVVNLYSQEYFQLIHDRLAPGGIVTYWLPVFQLDDLKARTVLRGFSNVFKHSSIWVGSNFDWMMVGMKEPLVAVSEEAFKAQWDDPVIGAKLRTVGFERPEQLGAMFICDGDDLRKWMGDAPPLTDDFPQRLNYSFQYARPATVRPEFWKLADPVRSKINFLNSPQMRQVWPKTFLEGAAPYFQLRQFVLEAKNDINPMVINLDRFIRHQPLNPYIAWSLGSDEYAWRAILAKFGHDMEKAHHFLENFADVYGAAHQNGDHAFAREIATAAKHIAAMAVQQKRYLPAARFYAFAARQSRQEHLKAEWTYVTMYLLCCAGKQQEAAAMGQQFVDLTETGKELRKEKIESFWERFQRGKPP